MAEPIEQSSSKSLAGLILLIGAVLLAGFALMLAIHRSVVNPRTDDAEVFANFIGMSPQVEGPIAKLAVHDNQRVRRGDLLFEIDDRPYVYALERALSEQSALEGQIVDERRHIAAQTSAIDVARASVSTALADQHAQSATVAEAMARVDDAKANIRRLEAERNYVAGNLQRIEKLLAQQFVTVDEVDHVRAQLQAQTEAIDQARAGLRVMEAQVTANTAHVKQSVSAIVEAEAHAQEATHAVQTTESLTNQREARAAAVRLARYNLSNCRVYAPFDALVTNLTISEGEFAHVGKEVFTLIDARSWWVVANFRETQLNHVASEAPVDIFLMQHIGGTLHGTVESIGYGVTPDPSVAGVVAPGLPNVQRSLSWVHLAARYPVRIRIQSPPPDQLRIGQTAVVVIHPDQNAGR